MRILICDIDGCIADCSHRLHWLDEPNKSWDKFFEACVHDAPIERTIQFLQDVSSLFRIVYITGRPERTRKATVKWFMDNGVPCMNSSLLMMRGDADHREDHVLKKELFENMCMQNFGVELDVAAVIEDRDQVVKMWRDLGLLCLQPKKGDY